MTQNFLQTSFLQALVGVTKHDHKHPRHHNGLQRAQLAQLKKQHWVLSSVVILAGSWITHSTTAMIADNRPGTEIEQPVDVNEIGIDLNTIEKKNTSELSQQDSDLTNPIEPAYTKTISHKVKRGESLGIIFKKKKFDQAIPYKISQDPIAKQLISLAIGKTLTFGFDENDVLREIRYPSSKLQTLVVKLGAERSIHAQLVDVAHIKQQRSVSAEIAHSLYESALESDLSITNIMEMVRIFGWDIDFVLDIRPGDHFHVIYEEYIAPDGSGEKLTDGNILAAEFTTQGKTYRAIRFTDGDGESFFNPKGESMLGTFLRSPVEFSRISSRFGKRKHPILKTWRAHKGVDYAAARGTPIRATADGKVVLAGKNGGYGNTVILRHAGRFTTLYAHMSGFAKGVRRGKHVKQGDVIGYIGSTGLATGPHLHYEFRLDGVHRNPLTFKTPKASAVAPELRAEFDKAAKIWMAKLDKQQQQFELAKSNSNYRQL